MDTREATKKYRMNKWAKIIRECRSSGETVARWCLEHDINQKTYCYWQKKVRTAACEAYPSLNAGNNPIVPINIPVPGKRIKPECESTSAGIIIKIGEASVEVYNSATQEVIEKAVRSLRNAR